MDAVSNPKSIELTGQLDAGHTYAGPPVIVDGVPVVPPRAPLIVLRDEDWICLRGPCRKYARFKHQIDAEVPHEEDGSPASSYADGSPVVPHTQTVHYCFPHPGVEMSMTNEVMTDCNLWDPEDPADPDTAARDRRRASYAARAAAAAAPPAPPMDKTMAANVIGELAARYGIDAAAHADRPMHVAVGANRPGGLFLAVQCSCGETWTVPPTVGATLGDALRARVLEAAKLLGPPKLGRAAAPPKMKAGEAAELLAAIASGALRQLADHKGDQHQVKKVTIAKLASGPTFTARVECRCGVPIAVSDKRLREIYEAGVTAYAPPPSEGPYR
jgi:hypothetical protein